MGLRSCQIQQNWSGKAWVNRARQAPLSLEPGKALTVTLPPPLTLYKMAHELGNPLDGVMRYVSLALRKLAEGNSMETQRHLVDAQFGLQRMAEILRGAALNQTAAPGDTAEIDYLIEQAIHSTAHLAQQNGVNVVVEHQGILYLRAGSNLHQVLCNLIKNAVEAMPHGGNLTIRTEHQAHTAVIRVCDTGPGIAAADLPRIFEPFFSTKAAGTGTGLGLAVCKEIIERLGGSISAANRPEGGCEFVIRLPLKVSSAS